jgi:hypothetical protein
MPADAAASQTGRKRSKLSSMEQLMFFWLNASEAAPKTATSSTPADTAASKPYIKETGLHK